MKCSGFRKNAIDLRERRNGRPVFIDTGQGWLEYFPTGAPKEVERALLRAKREQREADARSWHDIHWNGGNCFKGAYRMMAGRHRTASRVGA